MACRYLSFVRSIGHRVKPDAITPTPRQARHIKCPFSHVFPSLSSFRFPQPSHVRNAIFRSFLLLLRHYNLIKDRSVYALLVKSLSSQCLAGCSGYSSSLRSCASCRPPFLKSSCASSAPFLRRVCGQRSRHVCDHLPLPDRLCTHTQWRHTAHW